MPAPQPARLADAGRGTPSGEPSPAACTEGRVGVALAGSRAGVMALRAGVMRKIIVYIATSADGFIARPDGGVEWLDRPRTAGDYGMGAFLRSIDTILWGRKTYDVALRLDARGVGMFGPKVRNYVFSRRPPAAAAPGVEFVSGLVGAFTRRLRSTKGKNVWMMGGGEIIASFLDAGEIDEFVIHVVPTFIGEGIPLLAPSHRSVPLVLRSCRRFADGVVRLHYLVARSGAPRASASGR